MIEKEIIHKKQVVTIAKSNITKKSSKLCKLCKIIDLQNNNLEITDKVTEDGKIMERLNEDFSRIDKRVKECLDAIRDKIRSYINCDVPVELGMQSPLETVSVSTMNRNVNSFQTMPVVC